MRIPAMIVSLIMLVVLIVPPIMFLAGAMELATVKTVMLVATILWFLVSPFWLWKQG